MYNRKGVGKLGKNQGEGGGARTLFKTYRRGRVGINRGLENS